MQLRGRHDVGADVPYGIDRTRDVDQLAHAAFVDVDPVTKRICARLAWAGYRLEHRQGWRVAYAALMALSTLFLGRPGEWWDSGLILFAVVAGISTTAVGVFTAGSIMAHKREAKAAESALTRYKIGVDEKVAEATSSGIEAGRRAGEASGVAERARADVALAQADVARANERAAEANARAQEAKLALAEFAAPRVLKREDEERIWNLVKSFPGTPFVISIQTSGEALDFERQLVAVLAKAGWVQQAAPRGAVYSVPGQPPLGLISLTGIAVYVDQGSPTLFPAAVTIKSALEQSGYAVDGKRIIDGSEMSNVVHIYIGEKPRS